VPHAFYAPLIACVVTLATVFLLASSRFGLIAVDRPNERSLHNKPISRTGGLGLHAGILLAWFLCRAGTPWILSLCFVALLVVSLMDDIVGIPVLARLSAHLLAGAAVAALLLLPSHGLVAAGVAMLGIAWMTNLYNFMDGSDGLAGGMTVFGFGFYGIAAWQAGSVAFALLNLSIASAALAFLLFNFHPARIFMGDAGSVPLGFLAGSLGLFGWLQNDWAWWFPLLVFSPFVVDASVTLARRLLRAERVWQAHRDHYYQRLVQMGWGHRRTAVAEYLLMAVCGITALSGLKGSPTGQMALLVIAAAVYAAIVVVLESAWRRFRAAQDNET
jgi:UDP-GlcNAc:undecaprenyl-phosphate/decaprenyl-phosphate GlcNAc-1-phosphate transferase